MSLQFPPDRYHCRSAPKLHPCIPWMMIHDTAQRGAANSNNLHQVYSVGLPQHPILSGVCFQSLLSSNRCRLTTRIKLNMAARTSIGAMYTSTGRSADNHVFACSGNYLDYIYLSSTCCTYFYAASKPTWEDGGEFNLMSVASAQSVSLDFCARRVYLQLATTRCSVCVISN